MRRDEITPEMVAEECVNQGWQCINEVIPGANPDFWDDVEREVWDLGHGLSTRWWLQIATYLAAEVLVLRDQVGGTSKEGGEG